MEPEETNGSIGEAINSFREEFQKRPQEFLDEVDVQRAIFDAVRENIGQTRSNIENAIIPDGGDPNHDGIIRNLETEGLERIRRETQIARGSGAGYHKADIGVLRDGATLYWNKSPKFFSRDSVLAVIEVKFSKRTRNVTKEKLGEARTDLEKLDDLPERVDKHFVFASYHNWRDGGEAVFEDLQREFPDIDMHYIPAFTG